MASIFWFSLLRQVNSLLEVSKVRSYCCFFCFLSVVPAGWRFFRVVLPDCFLAAEPRLVSRRAVNASATAFRIRYTSIAFVDDQTISTRRSGNRLAGLGQLSQTCSTMDTAPARGQV